MTAFLLLASALQHHVPVAAFYDGKARRLCQFVVQGRLGKVPLDHISVQQRDKRLVVSGQALRTGKPDISYICSFSLTDKGLQLDKLQLLELKQQSHQ